MLWTFHKLRVEQEVKRQLLLKLLQKQLQEREQLEEIKVHLRNNLKK
jgi:hypothetical protein